MVASSVTVRSEKTLNHELLIEAKTHPPCAEIFATSLGEGESLREAANYYSPAGSG